MRAIVLSRYAITENRRELGLLKDFPHDAGVDSVWDITGRDGLREFNDSTLVIVEIEATDAVIASIDAHLNYTILSTDSSAEPVWAEMRTPLSPDKLTEINDQLTDAGYALRIANGETTCEQALTALIAGCKEENPAPSTPDKRALTWMRRHIIRPVQRFFTKES